MNGAANEVEAVRRFLREAARKGGQSTSERKKATAKANVARARAARELYRKYPVLHPANALANLAPTDTSTTPASEPHTHMPVKEQSNG